MALRSFIQILQLPLRWFAYCIQRVYINNITFQQTEHTANDKATVRKQRSWFDWPLIFLGNIVFRFRRVPLRVLYRGEWLRWERALKLALRNETIPTGTELLCETIPGQPLSQRLSDRQIDSTQRLSLLRTATRALKNLHKETVKLPGLDQPGVELPWLDQPGVDQPTMLSHGDAAISNVLYCEQTDQAEWFDFDLRHDLRVDAEQRHADDLRSLIFSAGIFCQGDELESLVAMVKREYGCERVWAALQGQIDSRWFWFDLFHLSQTRRLSTESPVNGNQLPAIESALVRLIAEAE